MTYFIVAIVMLMQPEMQSISIMQIPHNTIEECKQSIVEDGVSLQSDVMAMYPEAKQFSLVCIDKLTIETIVEEMKRNSIGKNA